MLRERIGELIEKIISVKGVFFISMLVLSGMSKIDGTYVFYAGLLWVGAREAQKHFLNGDKNAQKKEVSQSQSDRT